MTGTRKLKCSGDKPSCTRCQRENIVCIFSAQKQMGRPRKRRRGSEPGGDETQLGDVNENLGDFNDPSVLGSYGLVTPPQFQESDVYVDSNITNNGTPSSHYLADTNAFGVSPASNLMYVKLHDINVISKLSPAQTRRFPSILRYGMIMRQSPQTTQLIP